MAQQPNISARHKSMFDTYQQLTTHYGPGHHNAQDSGDDL